jgi:hypothetical protein
MKKGNNFRCMDGSLPFEEARKAGHTRFLGKPCTHGHSGQRYIIGRYCCSCRTAYNANHRPNYGQRDSNNKMIAIDHLKDKEPDYWDDM